MEELELKSGGGFVTEFSLGNYRIDRIFLFKKLPRLVFLCVFVPLW